MCGRVTLEFDLAALKAILASAYHVEKMQLEGHRPRYNIPPGQQVLSLLGDGRETRAGWLRWGFIPSWAADEKEGSRHFNARSETAAEKPLFKEAFTSRRCVVMAGSFYEWHKSDGSSQPYRILLKDQPLMPLAGIWTPYRSPGGSKVNSTRIDAPECIEEAPL